MSMNGQRKDKCADCGRATMLHWTATIRRCKPRCQGCGGTFFEPCSEGAVEQHIATGTARAIIDKTPRTDTTAPAMMRGEREVPGADHIVGSPAKRGGKC